MKQLTIEQVEALETEHNVYIDQDSNQFNLTSYVSTYGWEPIPEEWK